MQNSITPITLSHFTDLYNARRKETMKIGYYPKKFSIKKRKIVKPQQIEYEMRNGIPWEVGRTPAVSKEVFDTNGFTVLCQAVWKYYLGTDLKRISSEGRYRSDIGKFIPNYNKGIADLMGAYNGKVYFIEIKQPKEQHLESQKAFQKWTKDGGINYNTVRSFEDIYQIVQDIKMNCCDYRNV